MLQRAINGTWGIMRRAKLDTLRERLYLMDAVVKAGLSYSIEIWGWNRWDEAERIQRKIRQNEYGPK